MTTDSTWDSRDRLRAFGHRGDVAVGISTSGQSPNVLRAMSTVKKMGAEDSWVDGATGGPLADVVDYCICASSTETPRIQECHMLIGHIISE